MPSRLPSVAAVCLLTSLAACSDERSFRAPEELLGDWEQRGRSGSLVGEWSFFDDGTYRFVDHLASGLEHGGTYAVDGRELVTTGSGGVETRTYFATDEVVLLRALLPDGPTDDLIGTWRGGSAFEAEGGQDRYDNTLTVRETGSATFTQRMSYGALDRPGGESVWVLDGDWTVEGDRFVLREEEPVGLELGVDFLFVSGGALGEARLSRPAGG